MRPIGIAVHGSGQGHTHSGSVFSEASFRIAVLGSASGRNYSLQFFLSTQPVQVDEYSKLLKAQSLM
jgi:hypothetical protein